MYDFGSTDELFFRAGLMYGTCCRGQESWVAGVPFTFTFRWSALPKDTIIWLSRESNWRRSDYQPDSLTIQPPDSPWLRCSTACRQEEPFHQCLFSVDLKVKCTFSTLNNQVVQYSKLLLNNTILDFYWNVSKEPIHYLLTLEHRSLFNKLDIFTCSHVRRSCARWHPRITLV